MMGNVQIGKKRSDLPSQTYESIFVEYEWCPTQSGCNLTSALCRLKARRSTEEALRHGQVTTQRL